MNGIGTLQENSLHAALKSWYARPGDQIEKKVDGYVIDLVRGDLCVEIQTQHFSAIKRKLVRLIENHPVRLVYPIPFEKWIINISADGSTVLGRRKSPKRGQLGDLFNEFIRFPQLALNANFNLEVLMIREEVVWSADGRGSWRRKGRSVLDQRLLDVVSSMLFSKISDYRIFLPANLPPIFTAGELALEAKLPVYLARRTVYCLRKMGLLEIAGKRGRYFTYCLMS